MVFFVSNVHLNLHPRCTVHICRLIRNKPLQNPLTIYKVVGKRLMHISIPTNQNTSMTENNTAQHLLSWAVSCNHNNINLKTVNKTIQHPLSWVVTCNCKNKPNSTHYDSYKIIVRRIIRRLTTKV